jgi:hypothetical protein
MSKQNQKEAVFNAVKTVIETNGGTFTEGSNAAEMITKTQREAVVKTLVDGFKAGTIELNKIFDDSKISAYASGLVSNWLRKDKRLNGGAAYTPSKTGSTRSTDPQIKAMKALLASGQVTDPAGIEEINTFIANRQAEIVKAKRPSISVNFDALPESLREKFAAQVAVSAQ